MGASFGAGRRSGRGRAGSACRMCPALLVSFLSLLYDKNRNVSMMFQAAGIGGDLARAAGLQPGRRPCKGSRMRRRVQTEGCIAGWRRKSPLKLGRCLPRSARRFRNAPRRARSPALHCGRKRAVTRKQQSPSTPDGGRRPGECGGREGSFPVFCRVYGGREDAATRKDICRARCGTPPPPAATPPLAGEAFEGAAHRKAPPQGELDAPEGAD